MTTEQLVSLLGEMEYSLNSYGDTHKQVYKGIIIQICQDGGIVCLINTYEEHEYGKIVKIETVKQLKHISNLYLDEVKFRHNDGTYVQHKLEESAKMKSRLKA